MGNQPASRVLNLKMIKALCICATLLCLAAMPEASRALPLRPTAMQAALPVIIRNQGTFDTDGSVLYSVLLATSTNSLGKVTVSGDVPSNAGSVEAVLAPPGAIFAVKPGNPQTATWQLDSAAANSILGPFTYRVRLTTPGQFPRSPFASVSWSAPVSGVADTQPEQQILAKPASDSGMIRITKAGTVNAEGQLAAVPVGTSGIMISVPPGAVLQPVTLHITSLKVDNTTIPEDVKNTWWCAAVSISSSDAAAKFIKPILLQVPTKQTLTPGINSQVYLQAAGQNSWQLSDLAKGLVIPPPGNAAFAVIAGQLPAFLAIGVAQPDRSRASLSGSLISATSPKGTPLSAAAFLTADQPKSGSVQRYETVTYQMTIRCTTVLRDIQGCTLTPVPRYF